MTIVKAFDLKGYVRNLPDGRVKILAEGSDADLERFLKAIKIDKVDETREDIVSEVKGLRSDLKGRMEERLQRIESDVVEIKARMRS